MYDALPPRACGDWATLSCGPGQMFHPARQAGPLVLHRVPALRATVVGEPGRQAFTALEQDLDEPNGTARMSGLLRFRSSR